jgi:synaptic vesicle membrane protein VAT-1
MSEAIRRIVVHRPGGYDRLEVESASRRDPGPREVEVETEAVGVNFADVVVRLGLYPSAKEYVGWPITPGFEFSGRVRRVGALVTRFQPGDAVFGATLFGAYASAVSVDQDFLFPRPDALSPEQAGGFVVAPLTAWYALRTLGAVGPGKRVLVHSAAGGVGSMMVQIARVLGAHVVGVVTSPEKASSVQALGADAVIVRRTRQWATEARSRAPGGFDVVLDANGYETLGASYRLLRPTGRLVIYGAHSMMSRGKARPNVFRLVWGYLRTPRFHPLDLTNQNKSVLAFNLSYLFDEVALFREAMTEILAWFSSGQLRAPQIQAFDFDQVGQAHRALQSGRTTGKLVLRTRSESQAVPKFEVAK